jgi:hypothetical protein
MNTIEPLERLEFEAQTFRTMDGSTTLLTASSGWLP